MRKTIIMFGVALALCIAGLAYADGSSAVPDSGSAVPIAGTPADAIHDPLSNPAAAWNDLQAAQKVGWPLAILAGAVVLSKLLSRLGGVWSKLNTGKAALVIGGLSAVAVAAYNALAQGGSWLAVAIAAVVAAAAYWDAHKPATPAPAADAGGN